MCLYRESDSRIHTDHPFRPHEQNVMKDSFEKWKIVLVYLFLDFQDFTLALWNTKGGHHNCTNISECKVLPLCWSCACGKLTDEMANETSALVTKNAYM